jgi:transposase
MSLNMVRPATPPPPSSSSSSSRSPSNSPRNPNNSKSRKHWSPRSRTRIHDLYYREGYTAQRLGLELGVPRGTISGIAKRYSNNQCSGESLPRSGRPRSLENDDGRYRRHIIRCIKNDPLITLRLLHQTTCPHISERTLQRWLQKNGITRSSSGGGLEAGSGSGFGSGSAWKIPKKVESGKG